MHEVQNQARLNLAMRNRTRWPLGVLTGRGWGLPGGWLCLSRPGCGTGVCSLCDYVITLGALGLGSCLSVTIEKQHRRLSVMSSLRILKVQLSPLPPEDHIQVSPGSPLLRVAHLCSNP